MWIVNDRSSCAVFAVQERLTVALLRTSTIGQSLHCLLATKGFDRSADKLPLALMCLGQPGNENQPVRRC